MREPFDLPLTKTNNATLQPARGEDDAFFQCPISHDIMQDPVIAADGQTYEREYITMWLVNKDTSPMTNETLANKTLTPNHALKRLIQDRFSQ